MNYFPPALVPVPYNPIYHQSNPDGLGYYDPYATPNGEKNVI